MMNWMMNWMMGWMMNWMIVGTIVWMTDQNPVFETDTITQ